MILVAFALYAGKTAFSRNWLLVSELPRFFSLEKSTVENEKQQKGYEWRGKPVTRFTTLTGFDPKTGLPMVSEGELRETRVFMEEVAGEHGKTKLVEVKRHFTLKLKSTYEPRQ